MFDLSLLYKMATQLRLWISLCIKLIFSLKITKSFIVESITESHNGNINKYLSFDRLFCYPISRAKVFLSLYLFTFV